MFLRFILYILGFWFVLFRFILNKFRFVEIVNLINDMVVKGMYYNL